MQYYTRLKERVKDKIVQGDRPMTLDNIIKLAIRVDNR